MIRPTQWKAGNVKMVLLNTFLNRQTLKNKFLLGICGRRLLHLHPLVRIYFCCLLLITLPSNQCCSFNDVGGLILCVLLLLSKFDFSFTFVIVIVVVSVIFGGVNCLHGF